MISVDFIRSELRKVTQIQEVPGNGGINIICPFHKDTDPSCNVSTGGKVAAGIFNCHGCGTHGVWNKLADKLGMATIAGDNINYVNALANALETEQLDIESLNLSEVDIDWRGFPKSLLESLGAKKVWEEKLKDYYLFLPVTYNNLNVGYIRCRIYDESIGLKYWFKLKEKVFYPFDYYLTRDASTMVLVEGVTDALTLIKHGIPTLATLGTNFNFKRGLEYLDNLGVVNVILCYDGDVPGIDAVFGKDGSKGLAELLENKNFVVRVLVPPDDTDPDTMPDYYISTLKKMVIRLGGTLL